MPPDVNDILHAIEDALRQRSSPDGAILTSDIHDQLGGRFGKEKITKAVNRLVDSGVYEAVWVVAPDRWGTNRRRTAIRKREA